MNAPLRILVVEDEMTIALLIEDMLTDLGHKVVGLAMRLPQAMEMARTVDADLAILDINLDGRRSFGAADELRTRGIAVAFASGYGSPGLEPPYEGHVVIQKPFQMRDLQRAVDMAMNGHRSGSMNSANDDAELEDAPRSSGQG